MATNVMNEIVNVEYGRDGRSKTSDFATDEPNVVLSVYTGHRNGGSYFSSAMGQRNCGMDGPFTVTKSSPMYSKSVGQSEVGKRFSAKNLDAAHAEAVARVQFFAAERPETFAAVLAEVPGEDD